MSSKKVLPPSRSSSTSSKKDRVDPSRNVYLILPASVSGDLWHCAAAALLARKYGKGQNKLDIDINVVTVLVISNMVTIDKDSQESQSQKSIGATTCNFLKDLGLDCIIAMLVPPGKTYLSLSKAELTQAIYNKSENANDLLDEIFNEQQDLKEDSFMTIINKKWALPLSNIKNGKPSGLASLIKYNPKTDKDIKFTKSFTNSRILDYLTATTIAMQYLTDPSTRLDRLAFLRSQMGYGIGDSGDGIVTLPKGDVDTNKSQTTEKKKKIDRNKKDDKNKETDNSIVEILDYNDNKKIDAITKAKLKEFDEAVGEIKATGTRIVIYNHRVQEVVNTQTNSSEKHFKDFLGLAKSKGFDVVVINSCDPEKGLKATEHYAVFDLFNKSKQPPTPFPGLNPLATCRFWSAIAQRKDVFGVYSGRSGSLDVAAFNGVNCFYWDYPYMEIIAKQHPWIDEFGWKEPITKDEKLPTVVEISKDRQTQEMLSELNNQFRQTLRCMQLLLVTGIGYPQVPAQAALSEHTQLTVSEADLDHTIHHATTLPLALEEWLNGRDPRTNPIYPACPPIPDALGLNNWLAFAHAHDDPERSPVTITQVRKQYLERWWAPPKSKNGARIEIKSYVLGRAGWSDPPQKSLAESSQFLDVSNDVGGGTNTTTTTTTTTTMTPETTASNINLPEVKASGATGSGDKTAEPKTTTEEKS